MDGNGKKEDKDKHGRDEIFSRAVRAGKRTYFFDVKETRKGDYYLTITESKKRYNPDGNNYYEKHKIFLYKEDFEKFSEGLETALEYIVQNIPDANKQDGPSVNDISDYKNQTESTEETGASGNTGFSPDEAPVPEPRSTKKFTDVKFEDLDEKEKPEQPDGKT